MPESFLPIWGSSSDEFLFKYAELHHLRADDQYLGQQHKFKIMRGPESTIVEKYFERHSTGPDSVAYHCIICAGRSMKDYTRHSNSKAHQDKIASFKAQLELFEQADCQVPSMALGPGPGSMEISQSKSYSPIRDDDHESSGGADSGSSRQKRPRITGSTSIEDRTMSNFISYNSEVEQSPQVNISPPATLNSGLGSNGPVTQVAGTSSMSASSLQNFNRIATGLNLDDAHREMARKVCDVNGDENRFFATICHMTSIRQEIMSALQARPVTTTRVTGGPAANNQWIASESFRDWARHNLAKLITDHTLEAYSATTDANKQPIPRSFERLMMQLIRSQSRSFMEVNLPAGFGSEDAKPAELVLKVVKDLAKHARSNFRAILLMHILPENGKMSTLPIPAIKQIIGRIVRSHALKTEFRTDDEIERSTLPAQKLRYAYLRLEAVHFHKCPESNGRRSQWSAIDERLAMLGTKSYNYQETFYTLCSERDAMYFDGSKTYDELQQITQFDLPTEAEVEAAMADIINQGVAPTSVLQAGSLPVWM